MSCNSAYFFIQKSQLLILVIYSTIYEATFHGVLFADLIEESVHSYLAFISDFLLSS